jgi:hypothetical protein
VMPNHFHLIVRQGARPLGWVMQPIMRRVALFVQRTTGAEDHVFGSRFFSCVIETPEYLRTSIVYANLNPQRAKLCNDPGEYMHSSHHRLLSDCDVVIDGIHAEMALRLFADKPASNINELRAAYLAHAKWRVEKDAADDLDIPYDVPPPRTREGDRYYMKSFIAVPVNPRRFKMDLRDKALEILEEIGGNLTIEELRRRTLPRSFAAIRCQLIAGLLMYGCRGKAIAEFLRISESAVSKVATALRYGYPAKVQNGKWSDVIHP